MRRSGAVGRAGLWTSMSFVGPFLLVYAAFLLYPLVQAVRMSFYDWDLLGLAPEWRGAENYVRMLWGTHMEWGFAHLWQLRLVIVATATIVAWHAARSRSRLQWCGVAALLMLAAVLGFHPGPDGMWYDRLFWESFKHTLQFTLMSTPLIIGLGLAMALAVNNSKHRGGKFYQVAFFVPYVLPISVATLVWTNVLSPRGILSAFLAKFGVEPISWLGDQRLAMPAIVVMTAWWTVGFNLVLFSAGLQDIDPALYEAAMLDGAGAWQRFVHVTLPGLRHVMALVLVMQIIAGFVVFGQINIMTSGGPGNATRTLVLHLYETGFTQKHLGAGAAMALFLFAVMFVISLVQLRLMREEK
ncbi:MAG: sugar ABC transporter permease [Micromonosporaceae bacterium]|nr:sugar ABC transporter permease [Micromonosporaceae bacterium]